MQPDMPKVDITFTRQMSRAAYDAALATILAIRQLSPNAEIGAAAMQPYFLTGIWYLLLDIRDRLPPPDQAS